MIYVLGSIENIITVELEKHPRKGETVTVDSCTTGLGGRGAIQAATIAKLGGIDGRPSPVRLIGRVGKDAEGAELIEKLDECNVDTVFVRQVNRTSGKRVRTYAENKDDRVMVYTGANSVLNKTDIDEALSEATGSDTLLCQLDVPLYTVAYALRKAHEIGMTTVLNPTPAKQLPNDIYYNIDMIVLNRDEIKVLTGITPFNEDAQRAAIQRLHAKDVQYVALTLGEKGCMYSDGSRLIGIMPARKVNVEDKTGAGDVFVGAFALAYPHTGMYSFAEACRFACRAASLSLTRRGGVESIPTAAEVYELYSEVIKKTGGKK